MKQRNISALRDREEGKTVVFAGKAKAVLCLVLSLSLGACTTDLQTKVSGNLNQLSKRQTIAILPIEVVNPEQEEAAEIFRQSLHAHLKQSNFQLLEHYVVDSLLEQNGITDPSKFRSMNPMEFGETLGVDAVLISRMNRVVRTYLLVHSSIELSVSVQLVDTRNGEILWLAEQTESDFQGIGKIPTSLAAVVITPIYFVTSTLKLRQLTTKMVDKLTSIITHPQKSDQEKAFSEPLIAASWKQGGEIEDPGATGEQFLIGPGLIEYPSDR